MSNFSDRLRAIILVAFIIAGMLLCGVRLMKIQIVQGKEYLARSKTSSYGKQVINAARGEIVDVNGVQIVKNKAGFNIIIEKAFFPDELSEGNEIILRLAKLLDEDGVSRIESIPISKSVPYTYLPDRERDIAVMRDDEHLRLNVYATANDCIDEIIEKYEIAESYSIDEKRIIAGVRYEMMLRGFSVSNRYTFAEDVPMETVSKVKELSYALPGVDVSEEAIREYAQSDILVHSIGTIGPIYAEEYSVLKDEGYALNDSLGKSGIEKYMEEYLRGQNGTRTTEISGGKVTSVTDTVAAVPGNTVRLTVDSDFQREVQQILASHIEWSNEYAPEDKGRNAKAGAIVVLDVKTGAVKAMASYPSYDINDYISNYSEVANGENSPLLNRAIDGLYRPGSTFKTVVAAAALNEGIVTSSDTVDCTGKYHFYNDANPPGCTGVHGLISVSHAITVSCNIYFYDVGRRLGIEKIDEYASYFGLGEDLGLEIGGSAGWVSSPEIFTEYGQDWVAGQVLQTAIGQSETAVTPLQMAVQAATLANKGVRYKPYIIDSVYDYNQETLIKKTQPIVASKIPVTDESIFDDIEEGMIGAANFAPALTNYYYDDYTLTSLPGQTAIKTGTPQKTKIITNTAAIGYYPVDDPEIAFAFYVEEGEYSKYMIRQVIDAYYGYGIYADGYVEPQVDEYGNVIPAESDVSEETEQR